MFSMFGRHWYSSRDLVQGERVPIMIESLFGEDEEYQNSNWEPEPEPRPEAEEQALPASQWAAFAKMK